MNKLMKWGLLGALVIVLAGCGGKSSNPGFFQEYFVVPFTELIHYTAALFNGSYGIAIILITILIRLILAPFFMKMTKNQRAMKEKMDVLKPEMNEIQKQLKETKDPQKQKELQQEMMQLYKKHGVNPLNMGCLPVLIQLPILMGFYYAIRSSKEIAASNFLWFNLGHTDIAMAIIACIVYLFQFLVSQANMPEDQKKMMRVVGLMSPAFILYISLKYPAALPLYWSVSGMFLIVQTLITYKVYPVKNSKSLKS
ncbi:MAG TPA: membrane protein insertase YidC [Bacillales bacterium]|nr:membrane protein insertase YidC [Bacillales bacterium]